MTVNLTRIYTRLGDSGETHLGDMSRVAKVHPRVEAYGTVDELNATVGLALLAAGMPARVAELLARIQNDLLDLGADLSVPPADAQERGDEPAASQAEAQTAEPAGTEGAKPARENAKPARERLRITPSYTEWLEGACDELNSELAPLRSFVIPGGNEPSARLHICRTVCRRAERRALAVEEVNPEVIRYLNRLSDLLFILARTTGEGGAAGSEPLWEPGAHEARRKG